MLSSCLMLSSCIASRALSRGVFESLLEEEEESVGGSADLGIYTRIQNIAQHWVDGADMAVCVQGAGARRYPGGQQGTVAC